MTLSDFDSLKTGSRVKLYSEWLCKDVYGTVTRILSDEIKITWEDDTDEHHMEMTILRHHLRIYSIHYDAIKVVI